MVGGIAGFLHPGVAQALQELGKLRPILGGHLQADQNAPVVGPLVAVVKQRDVPVGGHEAEELEQSPRPLRKDKAQQAWYYRGLCDSLKDMEEFPEYWEFCELIAYVASNT